MQISFQFSIVRTLHDAEAGIQIVLLSLIVAEPMPVSNIMAARTKKLKMKNVTLFQLI